MKSNPSFPNQPVLLGGGHMLPAQSRPSKRQDKPNQTGGTEWEVGHVPEINLVLFGERPDLMVPIEDTMDCFSKACCLKWWTSKHVSFCYVLLAIFYFLLATFSDYLLLANYFLLVSFIHVVHRTSRVLCIAQYCLYFLLAKYIHYFRLSTSYLFRYAGHFLFSTSFLLAQFTSSWPLPISSSLLCAYSYYIILSTLNLPHLANSWLFPLSKSYFHRLLQLCHIPKNYDFHFRTC